MVKSVFLYLKVIVFLSVIFLTTWMPAAAQTGTAQVKVNPAVLQIKAGETGEVTIQAVNVTGLYAFDVALSFDPQVLEVVDADPTQNGVQVGLGTFLDSGFVIINSADNGAGTLRFAMTQVNPAQPVTGTGVLIVVRFQGKLVNQGSALQLTKFQLATNVGTEIPTTAVNGQVQVVQTLSAPTNTAVPTQKVSPAVPTRTPLPPTAVPTRGPSPTSVPTRIQPTSTPFPTPTLTPDQALLVNPQSPAQGTPQEPQDANPTSETSPQTEGERPSLKAAVDVGEIENANSPGESDTEREIVLFGGDSVSAETKNNNNPGVIRWFTLVGSGLVGILMISGLMILIILAGTAFFLRRK